MAMDLEGMNMRSIQALEEENTAGETAGLMGLLNSCGADFFDVLVEDEVIRTWRTFNVVLCWGLSVLWNYVLSSEVKTCSSEACLALGGGV